QVSATHAVVDDLSAQFLSRGVRAKVLARRGEAEPAEKVAREAVAIVERTDSVSSHAKVLIDLAEVLCLAGRGSDAAAATDAALALYEQKGNVVGAALARRRLRDLTPA